MDEELCVCEHKKEEHLDSEACQAARLVTRTGLRVGYAFEDADMPMPSGECECPDAGNGTLPPGIFGGVIRPGGYRPR